MSATGSRQQARLRPRLQLFHPESCSRPVQFQLAPSFQQQSKGRDRLAATAILFLAASTFVAFGLERSRKSEKEGGQRVQVMTARNSANSLLGCLAVCLSKPVALAGFGLPTGAAWSLSAAPGRDGRG